jgi:hypothetical protein
MVTGVTNQCVIEKVAIAPSRRTLVVDGEVQSF